MASSAPLVSNNCAGATPRDSATSFSPASRLGYWASVRAPMLFSLASTRGEHPVVLSFMSRRRSTAGLLTPHPSSPISPTHLRPLPLARPHSTAFRMGLHPFRLGQRDHRCPPTPNAT